MAGNALGVLEAGGGAAACWPTVPGRPPRSVMAPPPTFLTVVGAGVAGRVLLGPDAALAFCATGSLGATAVG